jgi:hypothetical protein
MSDESIENHIATRYEIESKLGKGVSTLPSTLTSLPYLHDVLFIRYFLPSVYSFFLYFLFFPPRLLLLFFPIFPSQHSFWFQAYGIVWRAYSRDTGQVVALKKIFGAFQNKVDSQRTYREVFLLYKFRHGNVVRLLDVIKARNDVDLYLVFEYMGMSE